MGITLTGTVKQVLEEQSGEGRNGPWRKREFILETEGDYPKEICILQWGDDIDRFDVREGERLTAHVDIQSREYRGRWYTDVKAWRIEREEGGQATPPPSPDPSDPGPAAGGPGGEDPDDLLPF